MKRCSHCKVNEGTIVGTSYVRKGKKYIYYRCTPCNNAFARKYYHTPKGNKKIRDLLKKSYKRNRVKILARSMLNYHVRHGHIDKPSNCSQCGLQCKRIQAHHHDYGKPLEVIWTCGKCHWKLDHKL